MDEIYDPNQTEIFSDLKAENNHPSTLSMFTARWETRGRQSPPAYMKGTPPDWVKEHRNRDTESNLDYEIVSVEEEANPLGKYF